MTTETSDAALLQRIWTCPTGDDRDQAQRAAFADLVERHHGAVCATTFAVTGDRTLSEDLAQDAFLTAWRELPALRDPGRFRAWVCGIARHLGVDARRRSARRQRRETPLPTRELPDAADLEQELDARQSAEIVWEALQRLSPRYREVLVLYYRQGRSTAEVASALDLSVSAVEQRLSRGRKQLQRSVERLVVRSLEDERPSRGFVAAVVTAISGPVGGGDAPTPAPANLETTKGTGTTMTTILLGTGLVAAAAVLAITAWTEPPLPAAAPNVPGADAAHAGGLDAAQREHVDLQARRADQAAADASEPPAPALPLRLTKVSDADYAMNVEGGASRATLPPGSEPAIPEVVRMLRGVVIDAGGDPLPNAVVIGNHRLGLRMGSLRGSAGAVTDAEGRFALEVRTDASFTVLAAHAAGWTAPAAIAGGDEDDRLTLQVAPRGRVRGTVRREGEPVEATVELVHIDGDVHFAASVQADAQGAFVSPPLPVGAYDVIAHPGHGAPPGRTAVNVAAGVEVKPEVDVPAGAQIEVFADLSDMTERFALVRLFKGHHAVATPEAFAAMAADPDLKTGQGLFRMKFDASDPLVFEGASAGEFTACVITYPDTNTEANRFACATGTLEGDASYATVTVGTLRPAETKP